MFWQIHTILDKLDYYVENWVKVLERVLEGGGGGGPEGGGDRCVGADGGSSEGSGAGVEKAWIISWS